MSQAAKTSTLAIVALVCSFICQPLGLILGIIALIQISNSKGEMKGQGLAIAAIGIGSLMFVVGILAAIAIPNFIRYQNRAKQSEARTVLRQIRTAQEMFRLESNAYVKAAPTGGGQGSQRGAWDAAPCSEQCPGDIGACDSFACLEISTPPQTYFRYACSTIGGDSPAFTCAAVGDLDGDGQSGVLVVSSGPAPLPAIAAEAGCNMEPPTDTVFDCAPGTF